MIAARMRHGDAWSDASILNLSSRGLLLHTPSPPDRGTYVEVRRGAHVIVGRVVWAQADRFGVRAQDRLAIDSLVANASPDGIAERGRGEGAVERRAAPRSEPLEWRHSQSREKGRALQFALTAGFGFVMAACAYDAVSDSLSKPLSRVASQLGDAS